MSALRDLYASLGLEDVRTYVQSGNLVFRTRARDLGKLAGQLEDAIAGMAGFRAPVALRDASGLREVVEGNPFAGRSDVLPNRLHVHFLCGDPSGAAAAHIAALDRAFPEEMRLAGRELYVHYPNGAGQSKLTPARLDKALGTPCTARNWNTVVKLLEMAEALDRAGSA